VHQDWLPGESTGNSPLRRRAVTHRDPRYFEPPGGHGGYTDYGGADHAEFGGGKRRRPTRGSVKKRWILVPVAALAAILAGGIAVAAAGVGGINFKVVSPITLQALGVNSSQAAVGQTVTAGAKLVAEHESVLSEVAIAVIAPDGTRADFPHVTNWKLGTSQKVFSQSKTFHQVGTYRYWFTYKKSNRWIDLDPKQTFTVGNPSTATPAPTTPGATPSPSVSATTSPTTSPTTGPTTAPSPSGTSSTGGSSTPTTNPSLRGCAANPGACGYPTPATTGVPAGTALTSFTGDYYARTAGQVIQNMEINGCIWVHAPGVTIRNTRVKMADRCFYGISTAAANGTTTIDRVEVVCNYAHGSALAGPGFKASRVWLHGCENGAEINENSSIVDSVIAASEAGNSTAHGDGIQSQGGNNVVIRHNTMLQVNPVTSAIITNPTKNHGWVVEDNFMGGGAYTLYCPEEGTNFVVRNNRFVPAKLSTLYSAAYGLTNACGHAGIIWSGNIRDTDGVAVAA
jgi:hypothetical protein